MILYGLHILLVLLLIPSLPLLFLAIYNLVTTGGL